MYAGTKSVADLERTAPRMLDFDTEPMTIEDVEIIKVAYEAKGEYNEALLPPALHPTIPPTLTWLVFTCSKSPFGPFRMVQTRIGCRSGFRPRAFCVSAAVDNHEAADALSARWGFNCDFASVETSRHYDHAYAKVEREGKTVLSLDVRDPDPLKPEDIQWFATMNLAMTPSGSRLVQCDYDYETKRAERGRAAVHAFDAEAWGDSFIVPTYPVAGSLAIADVRFPRIRYICNPEELALTGTEVIRDSK